MKKDNKKKEIKENIRDIKNSMKENKDLSLTEINISKNEGMVLFGTCHCSGNKHEED